MKTVFIYIKNTDISHGILYLNYPVYKFHLCDPSVLDSFSNILSLLSILKFHLSKVPFQHKKGTSVSTIGLDHQDIFLTMKPSHQH